MTISFFLLDNNRRVIVDWYPYMSMGHYLSHVVTGAMGWRRSSNGDVGNYRFVMNGTGVFLEDQRHALVRDVISDGAIINVVPMLGGPNMMHLFGHGDASNLSALELRNGQ